MLGARLFVQYIGEGLLNLKINNYTPPTLVFALQILIGLIAPLVAVITTLVLLYVVHFVPGANSYFAFGPARGAIQFGMFLELWAIFCAVFYSICLVPAAIMAIAFMRSLRRTRTVTWFYAATTGAIVPAALFLCFLLATTGFKPVLGLNMRVLFPLIWIAGIGTVAGLVTGAILRSRV